jgi:integrase
VISVEKIWGRAVVGAHPRRQGCIAPLQKFLGAQDNPHARLLVGTGPLAAADVGSSRQLEHLVIAQYAKGHITLVEASDWLGLIYAALKVVDRGWNTITPTRLANIFPQPTSPFEARRLGAGARAAAWQVELFEWIRTETSRATSNAWVSAVILSGVLNGCLLDSTKVLELLERIGSKQFPEAGRDRRCYCFEMPFKGMGNFHLQRWETDPLTEMLLYRMPVVPRLFNESELMKGFGEILATPPRSAKELVEAAESLWSQRIPQIDVHAIRRRLQSHAIAMPTWRRFLGLTDPAPSSSVTVLNNIVRADAKNDEDGAAEADAENLLQNLFPWFPAVRAALASENRAAALESISRIDRTDSEIDSLFLQWVGSSLSGQSGSGKSISYQTAQERLLAALPKLLGAFCESDPRILKTPELEDRYWEILLLEDRDEARPILVAGIRDFHQFLCKNYGAKPIKNEAALFGESLQRSPVSADFLSFDEYLNALEILNTKAAKGVSEDLINCARITLILAFRCGLRRMEIFGLRLSDIYFDGEPVALVRPHEARRLKTDNSCRTIPLFAFLSRQELAELQAQANRYTDSQFLFPAFGNRNALSWIDRVCDLVAMVIREATGTEHLTLHHLRHACASWTYLRLRAISLPKIAMRFDHLPATKRALQTGKRLWIQLTGRAHAPTRAYAHQVGLLLGHSSAFVSLTHYVHTTDLILGAMVRREFRLIPRTVLAAATGLKKSAAYASLEQGVDITLTRMRAPVVKAKPETPGDAPPIRGRPRDQREFKNPEWIRLQTVQEILYLAVERGYADDGIASLVNIPAERVANILSNAQTWGAFFGLTDHEGRLAAAPTRLSSSDLAMLPDGLEQKLAEMSIRAPDLFRSGLEIHLENLDRAKWDVIFRGNQYLKELRSYLRFLKSLDVSTNHFSWVVRASSANQPPKVDLPQWTYKAANLDWWPKTIRRIGPPRVDRKSYGNWIGIQACDPVAGIAIGKLFSKAIFLTLMQIQR